MSVYQQFLNKAHPFRKIRDFRDLVYGSADENGKGVAFELREGSVTYDEFKSDYKGLCEALIDKGYLGCKIAVVGANSYGWILAYLAASSIGVAVPLDKELSGDDLKSFMSAAECSLVFYDEASLKKLPKDLNIPGYVINRHSKEYNKTVFDLLWEGRCCEERFDMLCLEPEKLHVLLFTSGTTGKSKGVCLSQRNICENIVSIGSMVKVDSSRHALSVLPLHHTYESTIGHLLILAGGGCISYCDGLRHVGKNINEYKPSVIVAVPLLLEHMLKAVEKAVREGLPKRYTRDKELPLKEVLKSLPLPLRVMVVRKVKKSLGGRLKLLIVGAAAVNPQTILTFEMLGITTYQGYGLTETAPLLAGNNDFFRKAEAVGLPIHGVELKIDSPDESGVGQIIAKGENIMLGYYQDQEATDAVLKDGWFYTGDLGRFDDDGYLYITGRCKNVIVTRNGKNIYPEELESKLLEDELIEEVVVVAASSSRRDDLTAKARVFPSLEVLKRIYGEHVPEHEDIVREVRKVVEKLNERIPAYKRITAVEVVAEPFEKTTTKKIKRYGANMA